jgi:hypothetical protein
MDFERIDHPVLHPVDLVPPDEPTSFERVEHSVELDGVVRQDRNLERAWSPDESTLAIGHAPQPGERQSYWQLRFVLEVVQTLVHKKLGFYSADAWSHKRHPYALGCC